MILPSLVFPDNTIRSYKAQYGRSPWISYFLVLKNIYLLRNINEETIELLPLQWGLYYKTLRTKP